MKPRTEPRQFSPGAGFIESGLPGDRGARIAARRAFVDLKRSFLRALDGVPNAAWLVMQVQGAEEPVDLWLLRAPIFSALDSAGPLHRQRDLQLRRQIDAVFHEGDSGMPSTLF